MADERNPSTNEIHAYLHCRLCRKSCPTDVSHKDWSRIQVGFTPVGIQIWCNQHDVNVMHIDFEGHKHPANDER